MAFHGLYLCLVCLVKAGPLLIYFLSQSALFATLE